MADMCGEDDNNKLNWLHVRLGRRASTVFWHFHDNTKVNYKRAEAAWELKLNSSGGRHSINQSRVKQNGEGWVEHGDDKIFAKKAYPDLVEAAKESFKLKQFFFQLNPPPVWDLL